MLHKKRNLLCVCLFMLSLIMLKSPVNAAVRDVLDVNGFTMDYQQPVLEKEGIVYVPMAETFFRIGGKVSWDGVNRLVTATVGDQRVVIKPDGHEAVLNGQSLTMQNQVFILNGRLYIPLDFFENLGYIATFFKNDSNFRYCFLNKPDYALKFVRGELLRAKPKSFEGTHAYILNYPQNIIDLHLHDGNIINDNLPFLQNMMVMSEEIKGNQGYNCNEGVQHSEKGWVLQVGKDEIANKYKKYGIRKLINNISTRTGNYGVYEYTNEIKQYLFDANGKLVGLGEEQEKGLALIKANKVLLATKLVNEGGKSPKYLFVDGDNIILVNSQGYLIQESYSFNILFKPVVLDLKKKEGSAAILGTVMSQAGNYQKIHGKIIVDGRLNDANSFDLEVSGATNLEVLQTVLSENKIIFLAGDGSEKYLGYYDLAKSKKDYHRLPCWVTDAQIINLEGQQFILFTDKQKIYVQQLDFNQDE